MQSLFRVSQMALAGVVLLVAIITFFDLPQPYPHWPTVGPIPVNPELVFPGLLGLGAILGVLRDELTVGAVLIGILSGVTLLLAVTSLYTLAASAGGGVFWGGFFTLISGIILAVGVIIQRAVGRGIHRRLSQYLQSSA